MNNEKENKGARTKRTDKKSQQAITDPQVRLRERQALQELPRIERRERPADEGGRGVLPSDLGRQRPVRYFSTFSGIGGFELGIQQAHSRLVRERGKNAPIPVGRKKKHGARVDNKQTSQQGNNSTLDSSQATCVGFSEIDKYAAQIYQSHFPDHKNYGDITTIDANALPDFDLFVGGFPCQAFSIAGKRAGFNDTRGTLFFDVARILKAKRPRNFLLENVKGLLSHDNGRTFQTIVSALVELGYGVEWQVLNSKDFGVPQNRERVFIVGHLGGEPARKVFPLERDCGEAETASRVVSTTLDANYWKGIDNHGARTGIAVGTLRTHKDGEGFREVKSGLAPTLNARARQDGSPQGVLIEGMQVRRLTPTECERLQGFPDGWTEGVSDTQRYKCLGNAVTVNVIEAVVSAMLN
jgi:DNA (cytosine-5)-methyltransferase 1